MDVASEAIESADWMRLLFLELGTVIWRCALSSCKNYIAQRFSFLNLPLDCAILVHRLEAVCTLSNNFSKNKVNIECQVLGEFNVNLTNSFILIGCHSNPLIDRAVQNVVGFRTEHRPEVAQRLPKL